MSILFASRDGYAAALYSATQSMNLGRVCVPIDVNECENFDPTTVPQGIELLKQIENYSENSKGNVVRTLPSMLRIYLEDIEDYKKTSLKPYYDFMVKQFLGPLLRSERERQSKSDELF